MIEGFLSFRHNGDALSFIIHFFPPNYVSSASWLESLKVDGRWFRRRDSEKLRLKSYKERVIFLSSRLVSFRVFLLVVLHNASRNYARASRVVVDGGENGNVRAKISRNCPDESLGQSFSIAVTGSRSTGLFIREDFS